MKIQLVRPSVALTPYVFQIRTGRGKSLESLEDPSERAQRTFSPDHQHTFYYHPQPPMAGWRPRSYEDGDITPTNEPGLLYEGGGTLPRPRGVIRPRPVAKIAAKARDAQNFGDFDKGQFQQYKGGEQCKYHQQYNSPLMGKKVCNFFVDGFCFQFSVSSKSFYPMSDTI